MFGPRSSVGSQSHPHLEEGSATIEIGSLSFLQILAQVPASSRISRPMKAGLSAGHLPLPDRRECNCGALMNLKTLQAVTTDALLAGRIMMFTDMVEQDG